MVYTLDLRGDTYHFNRDESDKEKYMVFACAKNENDYIREWVDYHLSIGFDKIIICDNNEVGDDSLSALLEDYINEGTVEIFDIRGLSNFQHEIYTMFGSSNNYKWCAFIDIDEFIEVGEHYFNVKEFLSTINENCVLLNWMVFGYDNNLYHTKNSVQDTFKIPVRHIGLFKENSYVKSIVRGGSTPVFDYTMHTPSFDFEMSSYNFGGSYTSNKGGRFNFPPLYKHAYIRHYYSRSINDFFKKSKRSDAALPEGEGICADYKIAMLGNNSVMPFEKHIFGLYMYDNIEDGDYEFYYSPLDYYDVINIRFDGANPYNFIHRVFRLLKYRSGLVYILSGVISNEMFNLILDYSFETGNKVVYCDNDNALIYKAYLKYRKNTNNENYYYFQL